MLLLSWIARGGKCGIVTLDLLNCTKVCSNASPTHPSAYKQYDQVDGKRQFCCLRPTTDGHHSQYFRFPVFRGLAPDPCLGDRHCAPVLLAYTTI
jgi:hypothetical protein